MDFEIVEIEDFIFQGLKKRTTNENNLAKKDIGDLWNKFYSDNVSKRISYKISTEIFALFTEYKKDNAESYTYYLGYKVKKLGQKTQGLFNLMIPKCKYAVFDVFEPFPDALKEKWKKIWESNIDRAFKTDFEVYGTEFFRENEKKMKIYLSLI